MAAKSKSSKDKPRAPRKLKYDPSKILKHWEAGRSIREIADLMAPISRVFVHRTLTTKYPEQYEARQKARKAERA